MTDKSTIQRFFAGQASKAEVKQVLEWVYSDAFEKELPKVFKKYFDDTSKDVEWNEYHQLKMLKLRLKAPSKTENYKQIIAHSRNSRKSRPLSIFMKIAASLLVMVSLSISVWKISNHEEIEVVSSGYSISFIEKSTTMGQKSTIFLEDGSRVVLNSGSKIVFPEKFVDQVRTVELEGEAFFQVKSDSLKPFLVRTRDIVTMAVGTSFNVNAYEDDVVVSLVSGKVYVQEKDREQFLLSPGEQLSYREPIPIKTRFDTDEVTSWKDGILYFNNASFKEITERLERWYGVEIVVKNRPLKAKHYTGRFNNESLDNVLRGIGFINDFDFQISGKSVSISFN